MSINRKKICWLSCLVGMSFFAAPANSATSISASATYFDVTSGTAELTLEKINASSWVSPSMGFLGWTHFSKWGFMDLKKGQIVTITLDGTAVAGLHPAVSVWHRQTKKSLTANNPDLYYMDDHFYNQSGSVAIKAAFDDDKKIPVGSIIRNFVANAYDADGLGDTFIVDGKTYGPYLPLGYNQKGINDATKSYDKIPGKVALTFTAPKTGVYQFVVGALKPDMGSDADKGTGGGGNVHSIIVKVETK